MECPTKTLTFKVTRKTPELITPAGPTPHEFKPLSDIDDQDGLRMLQVPCIVVFKGTPSMQRKDPVNIIRDAIAETLVFYYPFAGRLREIATRKLVVECTAEGVLFVEADADVTLQQFADTLHPPFPNIDQLLYNVPGSDGIIDCPMILFQVTRLKCGGLIVSFRFTHTMSDAPGIFQFLCAIGELALGSEAPSLLPVWERHLLSARNPPCVSFAHPEYDLVLAPNSKDINMVERHIFFSATDISTLRCSLPPKFRSCSQFDLVTACVWRCRTIALSLNPNEEVMLLCAVSIRNKFNPPLPTGYYGNAMVHSPTVATAEELSSNPLHYVIQLVRKAKSKVTHDYVQSVMDLLVIRDRPRFIMDHRTLLVSDLGRLRVDELDFGWGKAEYCGVATGIGVVSWLVPFKNNKGENGVIVPISLPHNAMEVFMEELKMMVEVARKTTISNASAL